MPKVLSVVAPTAWSSGFQKLGQPVWLSNLVADENSGSAQPAQANLPARCSSLSGLLYGRSVPSRRSTSNCGPVSSLRHSSSLCATSNFSSGAEAPIGAALKARQVIVPPAASVAAPSKKPRLVSMSASIRCDVKNRWAHCGPIALAKSSRKVKLNVILSEGAILHNGSFPDFRLGSHGSTETHPDRRRRHAHRRPAAPALEGRGLSVTHCADGNEGLAQLRAGGWDALILDLMLPGVDGLEICRQARAMPTYTPIIITSARSSEVHRILGLELGADDYLVKPFSVLELVARVKALLRRADAMARNQRNESGALELNGVRLDPLTRQAQVEGRPLDLTPREFDLLYFFVKHPEKVFSRLDLLNQVWGYQHDGYEHTVNTHINRLRAKIEADPAQPVRILTVWGKGYRFAESPVEAK